MLLNNEDIAVLLTLLRRKNMMEKRAVVISKEELEKRAQVKQVQEILIGGILPENLPDKLVRKDGKKEEARKR